MHFWRFNPSDEEIEYLKQRASLGDPEAIAELIDAVNGWVGDCHPHGLSPGASFNIVPYSEEGNHGWAVVYKDSKGNYHYLSEDEDDPIELFFTRSSAKSAAYRYLSYSEPQWAIGDENCPECKSEGEQTIIVLDSRNFKPYTFDQVGTVEVTYKCTKCGNIWSDEYDY
jgi:hypothetical protein